MPQIWTIADAKARLSEVLRRASSEGPQRIGTQRRYVLVPEAEWDRLNATMRPLGAWLVDNMPRSETIDGELQLPDRRDPPRDDPFEPMAEAVHEER